MQRMSFQFITGTEQLRKISLCYIVRYLLFSYYIKLFLKSSTLILLLALPLKFIK